LKKDSSQRAMTAQIFAAMD